MEQWIHEAARLLRNNVPKSAAAVVMANFPSLRPASSDERLIAYAVAGDLFSATLSLYARNRDTTSEDDERQLDVAIDLARRALPNGHPLLLNFLKAASHLRQKLSQEVTDMERAQS
jgi:hypothetical protein